MNDDSRALREFAESGSESAFSALVERYGGMIFGVAMRRLENRQMSEEVTQNVFAILARKARRLKPETVLSGWLYRTALFECSHALRKETAHNRKMEALESQQRLESQLFENTVPELDEALARLSRRTRTLIWSWSARRRRLPVCRVGSDHPAARIADNALCLTRSHATSCNKTGSGSDSASSK